MMAKKIMVYLLTALIALLWCGSIQMAYAETIRIEMDTWETGTMFETGVSEDCYIREVLWDGMAQEERAALLGEGEHIGIWLSGWRFSPMLSLRNIDSLWLIDAPLYVYLSSRLGHEDPDLPRLYPGKDRICLYIAIEKAYAEANKIEEILRKLSATGIATFYSSDYGTGQYELEIDFSQVRQREFHKEANVTAKVERCVRTDLDTVGLSHMYIYAAEHSNPGRVSYWVMSGKIRADIPIHNVHANEQSENLDITYFEDDTWCTIRKDFTSTLIIPYDEIEPTYEEVVRMLKEAKLSCSFSPEPLMVPPGSQWGEFGPHYCIPFDLSALDMD